MIVVEVNPNGELEDAFKDVVERGARALLVAADPLYFNRRVRIAALAAQYKIPVLYVGRGGLLSYGPEPVGRLSADWRLCRPHPQRGQAPGTPGCVAAQMGIGDQS